MKMKAQKAVEYKIDGTKIVAVIDAETDKNLDSILISFGYSTTNVDSLPFATSSKHWVCIGTNANEIKLVLDKSQKVKDLPPSFHLDEAEIINIASLAYTPFGFNRFKKTSVRTRNGVTTFTLPGNLTAKSVILSGSFNEWSTLSMPMKKTNDGWQLSLKLPAGKHLYKFIVDGRWTEDKNNKQKEDDLNGGYNSIYFVYNYTFRLKGHLEARKVVLSASFNNWNVSQLKMRKGKSGWFLNLYVRPGTHAYKFIVDNKWILDPDNRIVRDDGTGNKNNFMSVGDTLFFRLPGYFGAKNVYCAGDFNGWNWSELKMYKSSKGWIIPYVLPPGNYEYKFKVDDQFVLDPKNPLTKGNGKHKNSVRFVDPNTTFALKGHGNANNVILSGTFNGWDQQGYSMMKNGNEWVLRIYLPPGKHLYKFLVDGQWIIDPDNKLWEKNQYQTHNSVIWVKQIY
jgi:hypothetical protein